MTAGRFVRYKDNGSMLWTPLLSWIVGLLGTCVFVSIAVIGSLGGSDSRWLGLLAILGISAASIAAVQAIAWSTYRKSHDVVFPRIPPARTPHPNTPGTPPARRRISWHRRGGLIHWVFAPTLALLVFSGIGLSTQSGGFTSGLILIAMAIAAEVALWFTGPAARFVVTPSYLSIESTFRRTLVPRDRLRTFRADGTRVRLSLSEQRFVVFRVDSPLIEIMSRSGLPFRTNRGTQLRTARNIVRMLGAIPYEPAAGAVVRVERRTRMVTAAMASGVGVTLAIAAIVVTALV
jgi:hypothetical protein